MSSQSDFSVSPTEEVDDVDEIVDDDVNDDDSDADAVDSITINIKNQR